VGIDVVFTIWKMKANAKYIHGCSLRGTKGFIMGIANGRPIIGSAID
jgi:hypothetical protein